MSILERTAPEPDRVLQYADRPDAVIDVYLPHPSRVHHASVVNPHRPRRTVVYLHGGFWRQEYDRTHARPLAAALARDGATVALPEFRRVGRGVGGGGGWPVTCDDVRAAVAAAGRLLGPDSGPDSGPVTLTGHSAGGHLALWLAATGTPADRLVALAPVGDLRHAAATHMGGGAVDAFLGSTEPVDDADPAVLLGRGRPAYPLRILHGTADTEVAIANSRGLVAQHPWIELVELAGVDHYDPIDPSSAAYPTVRDALLGVRPGDPTAD